MSIRISLILLAPFLAASLSSAEIPPSTKSKSVLYPEKLREAARANTQAHDWAREIKDRAVAQAKPWLDLSDEDIWSLMFGPAITRSWMVWSDGICPSCKEDVKMYEWKIDIWNHPFKVSCPHCNSLFPTNDFAAYHRSGFDEHGVFVPGKADRALLFNADHPDQADPLHLFGVDDGEGYVDGDKRWRFIGYYLVAAQWRQAIVGGARILSEAYLITGDPAYAHKAAVLFDRVADLYPSFSFKSQGLVYERGGSEGTVAIWHDACEEVRELAQAYDRIFDALPEDHTLVDFLSKKAAAFGLENPKSDFAHIQSNMEERILRETLAHRERINSNFPRTPAALLTIEAVLGWPENRQRVMDLLSEILEQSIKEDGLTGERGLAGYTTIFPSSFASLVMRFDRADPGILDDLFRKFPDLRKTYRFHIDTWCLQNFYPRIGDTGFFGSRDPVYKGIYFAKPAAGTEPSMFQFLWRVYEITGDPAFVQALYSANGYSTEGLPHDLFATDPAGFESQVQEVISRVGTEIPLGDVNLEQWGLSILRSGKGDARRAVWLDHDSGGRHAHHDGLNLGLFAKGLDLLPDFGYPPVGYGGWTAPKAVWYTKTTSHNTVTIDGKDQQDGKGRTTLWGSGQHFHIVQVAAPELNSGSDYERTIVMVDLDDQDSYIMDLFRVSGGADHARFLSSFYGSVESSGLHLQPTPDYGHATEMRNFQTDLNPPSAWTAAWTLEDRYKYRPASSLPVHLKVTDLTEGAAASLADCWIAGGVYGGQEDWVPRLMVRRQTATPPLASCFVAVLEPYEGKSKIASIRRVPLPSEDSAPPSRQPVALEIKLEDGATHWFVESGRGGIKGKFPMIEVPEANLIFHGAAAFVSVKSDRLERVVLCGGDSLCWKDWSLKLKHPVPLLELEFLEGAPKILTGDREEIEKMEPMGAGK
jgi:hypothetical protein